jgi:hypothetical protein
MEPVGERAAHMARVAHQGGSDASAGSGWRREGERDPRLVGWLGMLVARRVGLKATGPKGQTGQLGGWADLAETEEKIFQNKNWIFEFTKALEICTRRLRRNFDTRIVTKFF